MEERICITCFGPLATHDNGRECARCKWGKRPRLACAECGGRTGWPITAKRAPVKPLCRECKNPPQKPLLHGTKRMYRQEKCRCDECRAWKNEEHLKYVKARNEREPGWRDEYRTPERRAAERAKAKLNYTYTEAMRQRDAERRARKAQVTVEKFRNEEVFERDSWLCGICGESTDRSASFPNPSMPSLDHIIPLSLGGEHSRANTRCAHLGCNVKRGNRVAA